MPTIVIRTAAWLAVLLFCATSAACNRYEPEQRRLVSENERWRVWATGEFTRAGSFLGDAVVRFSVEEQGREFASGELYRAGGNDHSFDRQFPRHDWISRNVLRLFMPPAQQAETTILQIKNSAPVNVKWLLVEAFENILVLDLGAGESSDVPLMQMSDFHMFTVTGAFDNGARLRRSYSPSVPLDAVLTLNVDVAGTSLRETRNP